MALPLQLRRFTAPGVYLIEQDRSQIPTIAAPQGARLLVGNSRQGPVGRPILVQTWPEFVSMFGGISRSDERKGDFSKRMAFHMLQTAPIYYLSLRFFDDTQDVAGRIDLSTTADVDNAVAETVPYTSFFDQTQFWSIDPDSLPKVTDTTHLLTFANVGSRRLSVIVRKSTSFTSSLTFRQWYTNLGRTIPDFVYEADRVRDWFVDVHVFANDFSNASNNVSNPSYGALFDTEGVRKTVVNETGDTVDGIEQLTQLAESGYLTTFTGSLVPGFVDEAGNVADVVSLINQEVNTIGLTSAFNQRIFDDAALWEPTLDDNDAPVYASNGQKREIAVDLLGHNLFNIAADQALDTTVYDAATINTASYKFNTVTKTVTQTVSDSPDDTAFAPVTDNTLTRIDNALLPGIETVNGSDFDYSLVADNQLYAFEVTRPAVGAKYVGRDGNLATVNTVEFLGTKTFLIGFSTIALPIQDGLEYEAGNGGFSSTTAYTADGLILASGAYSSTSASTTVASVTSTTEFETADDISSDVSVGDVIKVGTNYVKVTSISGSTIQHEAVSGGLTVSLPIYVATLTGTVDDTELTFDRGGSIEIYDTSTDTVISTLDLGNDPGSIGLYAGGWGIIPTAIGYVYPGTNVVFPRDVNGIFVYPLGHGLSGQPVVGSIVDDGAPVNAPYAADSAAYTYQKNADGTDAVPVYPTIGWNPEVGGQETIEVDYTDLSAEQLAAVRLAGGTVQNVFLVSLDKSVLLDKSTSGAGSRDTYTSTGTRSDDSVLTLDDGTEIIAYSNTNVVYQVETFEDVVDAFAPVVLAAYRPRKEQFVDGTARRQNAILNMITGDLRTPLKNRNLIDFEYLVDGFKTYVEPSAKIQLSTIARERATCLAISSMPFMQDFSRSVNPYFSQTIGGRFDPQFIAQGGNLQLPHTNTFSLPVTGNTHIAFFGPGLTVVDGGESLLYPPAGIVSNNYVEKFIGGNVFDIVAGNANGRVSGTGVTGAEYAFRQSEITGGGGDLDVLYPFGYNAVVNRRSSGLQIFGNRTAQNNIETALSSIHVREIVKSIQLQMESLLEDYLFQYNTAENRLIAKTRADSITAPFVQAGALLSAQNVVDTTNNTAEIIENKLFIVDTIITANNGAEIAVHRTTINSVTNSASFELL